MADDITTRPMLEALLEGQRQLGSLMAEFRAALAATSQKYNRKINALNQCHSPGMRFAVVRYDVLERESR